MKTLFAILSLGISLGAQTSFICPADRIVCDFNETIMRNLEQQAKEIASLKAQVAKLKKAAAPAKVEMSTQKSGPYNQYRVGGVHDYFLIVEDPGMFPCESFIRDDKLVHSRIFGVEYTQTCKDGKLGVLKPLLELNPTTASGQIPICIGCSTVNPVQSEPTLGGTQVGCIGCVTFTDYMYACVVDGKIIYQGSPCALKAMPAIGPSTAPIACDPTFGCSTGFTAYLTDPSTPIIEEKPLMEKTYKCQSGWHLERWRNRGGVVGRYFDEGGLLDIPSGYYPDPLAAPEAKEEHPPKRVADKSPTFPDSLPPIGGQLLFPPLAKDQSPMPSAGWIDEGNGTNTVTACMAANQIDCVDVMCLGRNLVPGCPDYAPPTTPLYFQNLPPCDYSPGASVVPCDPSITLPVLSERKKTPASTPPCDNKHPKYPCVPAAPPRHAEN